MYRIVMNDNGTNDHQIAWTPNRVPPKCSETRLKSSLLTSHLHLSSVLVQVRKLDLQSNLPTFFA